MNHQLLYNPVCIPCNDEFIFIPPLDILFIEALSKYSRVYCINCKIPYITTLSITKMMDYVPIDIFCRVHRSYIVAIYHKKIMNKTRTRIYFEGGLTVHISEAYLEEFLQNLVS